MINKFLRIIKTIIVAIIGIYLANKFNILSYVSFVPTDKAFDVCLTLYFPILEIVSEFIVELLYKKFAPSELSAILSISDVEKSIDSVPVIKFNSLDLAEIIITIQINGKKKHFSNSQLILPNLSFATMQQATTNDTEISIDNMGNYIISLEKMFGSIDQTSIVSTFKVALIKEPSDSERAIEIFPELKPAKRFNFPPRIIYKHNKARLKAK